MLQVELPQRLRRHCELVYLAKADARFLERKQQLDQVVYSLVRLKDEGLAQELYLQLQDEEASFADLGAHYAEGPERATRGIVVTVPLTQAHPQLVERLRMAPTGVVQKPFAIEHWWPLFRVESFTTAVFDDAMAQQMSRELSVNIRYQDLRSPVDGVVFDLKPKDAGFVAQTSEPVMKIVPFSALQPKIEIDSSDIGFVPVGRPTDISIDSFPATDFGVLSGMLSSIGSDALPPDQLKQT